MPIVECDGRPVRPPAQRQPAGAAVAGDGAHAHRPAARARPRVRAPERPQPRHPRRARRLARHRRRRHRLLRPARGASHTLGDHAGARRRPHPQARHGVAARAAGDHATSPAVSTRSSSSRRRARSWRAGSRRSSTTCAERPRVSGLRESWLDADQVARTIGDRLRGRDIRIDSVEARLTPARRRSPPRASRAPPRARRSSARAARTTAPPTRRTTPPSASASAATRWSCSTRRARARSPASPRWAARARSGSARRRSPAPSTSSRTSATAPSTTPARSRSAPRSPPASTSPTSCSTTATVAMTGGQDVEGGIGVPDLTRWLEIEGVKRIIVTTDEPERYKGVALSPIAEVRPRIRADARRRRSSRRSRASRSSSTTSSARPRSAACASAASCAEPKQRIAINERVCEGCGDCGEKSDCLSVLPVADGVRPQDADPPGVVQQGLLLRRGRLPVVPRGHPGQGGLQDRAAPARRPAGAAARRRRRTTRRCA